MSLAALAVAYAAFSLLATGLSRGWGWYPSEVVEEDPRVVAGRLRAMEVPEGRARLCRDVAVGCHEAARRYGRQGDRLASEGRVESA